MALDAHRTGQPGAFWGGLIVALWAPLLAAELLRQGQSLDVVFAGIAIAASVSSVVVWVWMLASIGTRARASGWVTTAIGNDSIVVDAENSLTRIEWWRLSSYRVTSSSIVLIQNGAICFYIPRTALDASNGVQALEAVLSARLRGDVSTSRRELLIPAVGVLGLLAFLAPLIA